MLEPNHSLKLRKTLDEKARMNFVSGIRAHVLNDMASGMRAVWDGEVEPRFRRKRRRGAKTGPEVHNAIKSNEYFKFYSSLRVTAQDLVWQSVFPPLDRERDQLKAEALALRKAAFAAGYRVMVGCMVATSLSMAPAHLIAQGAAWVDLDGPLLLDHDRDPGLRFEGSRVHPPDAALWG